LDNILRYPHLPLDLYRRISHGSAHVSRGWISAARARDCAPVSLVLFIYIPLFSDPPALPCLCLAISLPRTRLVSCYLSAAHARTHGSRRSRVSAAAAVLPFCLVYRRHLPQTRTGFLRITTRRTGACALRSMLYARLTLHTCYILAMRTLSAVLPVMLSYAVPLSPTWINTVTLMTPAPCSYLYTTHIHTATCHAVLQNLLQITYLGPMLPDCLGHSTLTARHTMPSFAYLHTFTYTADFSPSARTTTHTTCLPPCHAFRNSFCYLPATTSLAAFLPAACSTCHSTRIASCPLCHYLQRPPMLMPASTYTPSACIPLPMGPPRCYISSRLLHDYCHFDFCMPTMPSCLPGWYTATRRCLHCHQRRGMLPCLLRMPYAPRCSSVSVFCWCTCMPPATSLTLLPHRSLPVLARLHTRMRASVRTVSCYIRRAPHSRHLHPPPACLSPRVLTRASPAAHSRVRPSARLTATHALPFFAIYS